MKIESVTAGIAGEYYVAAELSRQGYIASITLRNSRGIDILAANSDGSRSVTIQCKTNQHGKKAWILTEKAETFLADGHFYVFVSLRGLNERPFFHVVPSRLVAERVAQSHKAWLEKCGKAGQAHIDNAIRKFRDYDDEFLDRWDLLELDKNSQPESLSHLELDGLFPGDTGDVIEFGDDVYLGASVWFDNSDPGKIIIRISPSPTNVPCYLVERGSLKKSIKLTPVE